MFISYLYACQPDCQLHEGSVHLRACAVNSLITISPSYFRQEIGNRQFAFYQGRRRMFNTP